MVSSRFPGDELLALQCSGCGECCRGLRVAITGADVIRLRSATGRSPHTFIEWLAPDAVDMQGEPASFVELPEGRRLMVLRQNAGACGFLDDEQRCGVYCARPADCRVFPFDWQREPQGHAVRLALIEYPGCELKPGVAACAERASGEDTRRWAELRSYQDQVARWNRWASHRRRLRHRPRGADEFLSFLGV